MPFGLKTAIRFPVVEIHLLSMPILHFQITVLAQFQRRVFIRYHKGKHHLNGEHQGMEIPDNGGLIQKFYVVGRRNGGIENMINWDGKDKDTLALIKYIPFRYTFRSASSNAS